MKYFLLGGLDFIMDEEGRLYFIEANSAPGGMLMLMLDEREKIIEKIAKMIMKREKEPNVAIPIRKRQFDMYDAERARKLAEYFPTHIVFIEDQKPGKILKDTNGKEFEPNVILFNKLGFSQIFHGNALQINRKEVIWITLEKYIAYLSAEASGVNVPEHYIAWKRNEAKRLISMLGWKTFVLKPVFGQFGKGVLVFDEPPEELPKIRSPFLVEKRIFPKNLETGFWDIRSFVVDGKFSGAVIRKSEKPVVNIHQGGHAEIMEEYPRELKKASEKVAEGIEKVAEQVISCRQI